MIVVPSFSIEVRQNLPSNEPSSERYAQIDADAFRNLGNRNVNDGATQAEPSGKDGHKHEGVDREEQHLEDRIKCHQAGAVVRVAGGEIVPDDHHRNAPRQTDHDESDHVLGAIAQKNDREREHQNWSDYPILEKRKTKDLPVAEDVSEFVVVHLGQRRIHHQDETDRNRKRSRANAKAIESSLNAGPEETERHTGRHRQENPKRQISVEKGEPAQDWSLCHRHRCAHCELLRVQGGARCGYYSCPSGSLIFPISLTRCPRAKLSSASILRLVKILIRFSSSR